jgi:Flp pilus assembly protein TadB
MTNTKIGTRMKGLVINSVSSFVNCNNEYERTSDKVFAVRRLIIVLVAVVVVVVIVVVVVVMVVVVVVRVVLVVVYLTMLFQ